MLFIARKLRSFLPLLLLPGAVLAGCARQSAVCATDPPNQPIEVRQALEAPPSVAGGIPLEIRLRNRMVRVDQIVHGPLCDAHWSGAVYVDCDVQVPEWDREGEPTFFDGCDLDIEENTIVYVAYHNDEAYYQGCSCHISE